MRSGAAGVSLMMLSNTCKSIKVCARHPGALAARTNVCLLQPVGAGARWRRARPRHCSEIGTVRGSRGGCAKRSLSAGRP
jgi:hypothetical protein